MGMRKRDTNLYVVLLVVLTHQAVVYEMKTAAAPDMAIRVRRTLRVAGGLECIMLIRYRPFLAAWKKTYKFASRFFSFHCSNKIEKTNRTGIDNKLL